MNDYETELIAIGTRALRTVGAAVLIMIALVGLFGGVAFIRIEHSLPDSASGARQVSVVWGPGIAATVLAGVALLGSIGWLVWNLRTRPRVRWWLPAVVLVAGTFVVVFEVLPRFAPTF